MAAPSGIVWGSVANSKGRIGIYVKLTSTNTQTTRHTEVWVWTKYSTSDSTNTFYYNDNATTATTSKGSVTINTTSDSSWSTSNQKKIAEYDYTFNRGTSALKRSVAAKLTGVNYIGATMSCTTTYTIPALASYKVTFNANGGSGAPSAQTKYYGKSLTLSSTKPTRSGYSFVGWGTTASDTSANYDPGDAYTSNSAITLYAIWKKVITLSYNANGGSGAPSAQSATIWNATTSYKFTLSSTNPTRTGYTFLGWATSSTATSATYSVGASVTLSANTTLYAVWKINSYTLTINPNGGAWNSTASNSTITQNYNTTKSIPVPTWTGHTFSGWTLNGSGSLSSLDAVEVTYTFGAGNGILTAKWDTNDYTVMFDASTNEGTVTETNRIVEYGQAIGTLPIATKNNYTFLGWFTSATGGTMITADYVVTGNIILYAQFEIDASAWTNVTDTWKYGVVYTNVNGTEKKGHAKVNVNGTWKDGIVT